MGGVAGAAGHALRMNGAGAGGAGGGGACGRPTTAVDQVPTQCSAGVCARDAGPRAPIASASALARAASFRPVQIEAFCGLNGVPHALLLIF